MQGQAATARTPVTGETREQTEDQGNDGYIRITPVDTPPAILISVDAAADIAKGDEGGKRCENDCDFEHLTVVPFARQLDFERHPSCPISQANYFPNSAQFGHFYRPLLRPFCNGVGGRTIVCANPSKRGKLPGGRMLTRPSRSRFP
jgi:hypothetical protein